MIPGQSTLVRVVATMCMLAGVTACDAPAHTIAQLQNGGIALNGRRVGLKGKITNADVPRTRRLVRIGDAKVGLKGFELADGTGRVVVWYDPSGLSRPLAREDAVAVDAQISFPAGQGLASDMVVVAREVRIVSQRQP